MKKCSNKSNLQIISDYLNGQRPFTQISLYQAEKDKYRKEGEKWKDENNIEWQKINGKTVRLTKTQSDMIREFVGNLKCKCGLEIKWGNKFDKLLFAKTGMCQDCLANYETSLRVSGIYPLYENYKLILNKIGFAKDAKFKVKEVIDTFKNDDGRITMLCNSEGFTEKFHGTNKEKILKDAKEDFKNLNQIIKNLTAQKRTLKKEMLLKAKEFKIKLHV